MSSARTGTRASDPVCMGNPVCPGAPSRKSAGSRHQPSPAAQQRIQASARRTAATLAAMPPPQRRNRVRLNANGDPVVSITGPFVIANDDTAEDRPVNPTFGTVGREVRCCADGRVIVRAYHGCLLPVTSPAYMEVEGEDVSIILPSVLDSLSTASSAASSAASSPCRPKRRVIDDSDDDADDDSVASTPRVKRTLKLSLDGDDLVVIYMINGQASVGDLSRPVCPGAPTRPSAPTSALSSPVPLP